MSGRRRAPGYLTRNPGGLSLLTWHRPHIGPSENGPEATPQYGDPLAVPHIRPWSVGAIWGLRLPELEPVAVWVAGAVRRGGESTDGVATGYLTRRANGLYLLTRDPAELARVGKTDVTDAYPRHGDPIAQNYICVWAARNIFGVELAPLEAVPVWLAGGRRDVHEEPQGC